MNHRGSVAVAATLAIALASLTGIVTPASSAVSPKPFIDPAYANRLWDDLIKGDRWPATFPADWARPKTSRVSIAARTLPTLRFVGNMSLQTGAFSLGWRIGRVIDTRWLHLSGPIGEATVAGAITGQVWGYWPGTSNPCLHGNGGQPCWSLETRTTAQFCTGIWAYSPSAPRSPCAATQVAVWNTVFVPLSVPRVRKAQIPTQLCGGFGASSCWVIVMDEEDMEALVQIDRNEPYTSEPFSRSTTWTIPSMTAELLQALRNQIATEGVALENEINAALDPENWQRPWPDGSGGGPILDLPPASPFESYPDYLDRLRRLGWVGTATVVDLDEDAGDPAHGPRGIPCTSVRAGIRVPSATSITFYRNPASFSGGSSSSGWDCTAGTPAPPGGCEYDEVFFDRYTWEEGARYAPEAYERACADAWNHFINVLGGVLGEPGRPERETGAIKNPDLIARLEDGTDDNRRQHWRKWEWGPHTHNGLTFVIHAWKNTRTNEIKTEAELEYKLKFRTEVPPGYRGP